MLRGHIGGDGFRRQGCSTGGAVEPAVTFIVGIVIRRTANQSSKADNDGATASRAGEIPDDFYRRKLKEALGAGVEALNDPEIERKVEDYFRENPGFSRDAVHVAAVACRFKKERVMAGCRQEAASRQETFPRSLTI